MSKTFTMNKAKEEKFQEILNDHEELMKSICRYYSKQSEDSQDLYQEVLINVWKSLDNFRGDSKNSTWLYRVAVNTALSSAGRTFRHMKIMIHAEDKHLNVLFEDDKSLHDKYKLEAQLDILQIKINMLSVIDKALITLMLEGLSTKEIADVIGITEPNVRVKIHRIKEELKKQFNHEAESDI